MAPEVKERNRRATVCNRSTSCHSLMAAMGRFQTQAANVANGWWSQEVVATLYRASKRSASDGQLDNETLLAALAARLSKGSPQVASRFGSIKPGI